MSGVACGKHHNCREPEYCRCIKESGHVDRHQCACNEGWDDNECWEPPVTGEFDDTF